MMISPALGISHSTVLHIVVLLLFLAPSLSQSESASSKQLLEACLGSSQDMSIVQKALLDPHVNVNVRDPASGQTALMASVLRGKADFVEALLTAGADASIAEKDGYTPPHGAAFQGRTAVMRVLVKHGVAQQEYHNDGYLPFHRACWGKTPRHAEFVAYVLESGVIKDANVLAKKNGLTCKEMTTNQETLKVIERYVSGVTAEL